MLVLGLGAALLLAAGWYFVGLRPSASRDWAPEHARPALSSVSLNAVRISSVRDFRYDSAGNAVPHYYSGDYPLDDIETAWFVLTTFSKRSRAPAHTMVSFGFSDGRYLAISVEARRERDERYGILRGLLRQYELIYVVGDERDLIGRRATVDGDPTYLYPVRAPRDKIRLLFASMLDRANQVELHPEFYHSLFNSCASNLVRHVNEIAPGRIPAGWKVLVPGYTDDVALSLGLIDDSTDVAAARRRYRVNERAAAAIASDSFSTYIRGAPH